ncbi:MAG: phosphate acetyltransferase [Candidatus Karelsulcia muelleri]
MYITPQKFKKKIFFISKNAQKHIVLPEGEEERIIIAASIFIYNKLGKLTLLGDKKKIKNKIKNLNLFWDEKQIKIINPKNSIYLNEFAETFYELRKEKGIKFEEAKVLISDFSYFGTMMVYKGITDGMVSGAVNTTAKTVRPAFQIIKPKIGIKTVSSMFFMLLQKRVIIYSDCAIISTPTSEQLAEIAICSAETAKLFGIKPKIAMLSYSSGNSGLGKEVEKVRKATEIVKYINPSLRIDGPIQYDAAVEKKICKNKLPNSKLEGKANIFIFPDLNSGNNTYKAVKHETKSISIGPILQGLKKPINDLSRGSTVKDIYNTIIITCIQAHKK